MARAGDRKFREIFFAHMGLGPYSCAMCEEDVDFLTVLIHHVNHDHTDNRIENLVPAHRGCHAKHHNKERTGKKATPETKAKMSKSQINRWADTSEEKRSAIGKKAATTRAPKQSEVIQKTWETRRQQGNVSIIPSEETKAKMSASQLERWAARRLIEEEVDD